MRQIFLLSILMLFFHVTVYASDYAKVRHVTTSHNDANTINKLVSNLSSQLTANKNFENLQDSAIAITSFVSLDNLKATSRLSNILSENLIHEMQVRGYKVIDFKTMEKITIDSRGDFLFTRDIAKLRSELNIDYALTGTYVKYRSGTVVNARIIDDFITTPVGTMMLIPISYRESTASMTSVSSKFGLYRKALETS